MAKIKNFVYCYNIDTSDGNTNIQGLISAMTPEYIPGLFSFSINFTLLDLMEGEHFVDIRFYNPDHNLIADIERATVDYKKDIDSNLPDAYLGVNMAANFQNIDLKISGLYSTEVILDGTPMGKFEIYVKGKNEV